MIYRDIPSGKSNAVLSIPHFEQVFSIMELKQGSKVFVPCYHTVVGSVPALPCLRKRVALCRVLGNPFLIFRLFNKNIKSKNAIMTMQELPPSCEDGVRDVNQSLAEFTSSQGLRPRCYLRSQSSRARRESDSSNHLLRQISGHGRTVYQTLLPSLAQTYRKGTNTSLFIIFCCFEK